MATAVPLLRALGVASRRVATLVDARDTSHARFRAWAAARDPAAPLALIHAPSAGEWRQAEPVVAALRSFHPGLLFAFTYTSPSAVTVAAELAPAVHGYLPWDRPRDVGAMLDVLRPSILVITKLDVWPELARQARARGLPIVLIAATVRERSTRLHGPGRLIVRSAYEAVELALAVGPEDAVRLAALGVAPDRISVVGDPRYDGVLERLEGLTDRPVTDLLVAGSTWPADERILLEAFRDVREEHRSARLLLVPHRPGTSDAGRIARLARRVGLPGPEVITAVESLTPEGVSADLMLVPRVGGLARWYGLGTLAYVGGGFGRGLHSVLEPAAWGRPIFAGPRWRESAEATALERARALTPIEGRRPAEQLAHHWAWLLGNPDARYRAGLAAKVHVEDQAGAARIIAGFVLEAMQTEKGRD